MPAFSAINHAAGQIIPEIILLLTVCVMFLAAPFLVSETGQAASGLRHRWGTLAMLALLSSGVAWYNAPVSSTSLGPFLADEFVWFVRGLTILSGFLLTLVFWDQVEDAHAAESLACLLAILAGVNFVALANDLVGLFLGLELVSIPTYVLLSLNGRDKLNQEATIKYFLLSIFSSALVLYGLAWIFGIAGTTDLSLIAARMQSSGVSEHGLLRLGMVLAIGGLCFRLAAVPFHFYAPDVFQGVAAPSAAMLSLIPKVVGFAALLRLLPACVGSDTIASWMPFGAVRFLLCLIAVITMTVGNLLALRQTHLLRLLAYSSIAHAGYMLVGLTVGNVEAGVSGLASLLFYLSMYGVMTVGVFALISAAGGTARPLRLVSDLAGLSRIQPATALLLAICVFGLSGLPPTGGFLAKLNLFLSAWTEGSVVGIVLAVSLALNAVVAASYYLRLISVMYFESAAPGDVRPIQYPAWIAGAACAAATIVLFVTPNWLWSAALFALG